MWIRKVESYSDFKGLGGICMLDTVGCGWVRLAGCGRCCWRLGEVQEVEQGFGAVKIARHFVLAFISPQPFSSV